MSWLMSYVLVLAAAVIPTIRAGMPKKSNCLLINLYLDLESVFQSENATGIKLLLVVRQGTALSLYLTIKSSFLNCVQKIPILLFLQKRAKNKTVKLKQIIAA